MPITQLVNGLIVYEGLDTAADLATWTFGQWTTTYGEIIWTTGPGISSYAAPGQSSSFNVGMNSMFAGGVNNPWLAEVYLSKTLNLGSGHGRRVHVYVTTAGNVGPYGCLPATCYPFSTSVGVVIAGFTCANVTSPGAFQLVSGTIPDTTIGATVCYLAEIQYNGEDLTDIRGGECWVDHLVICLNDNLTITGLTPGQKISVYNAAGTLLVSSTVAAAQNQLILALPATEPFPEQMYLQVYALDGQTLIETTPLTTICGGDVWAWSSPVPELQASAANFIIYAKNSAGPTKRTTISMTLLQGSGTPYVGAKLQLSATIGTLSATSVVTNNQGFASVSFSSGQSGLAVITVTTAGYVNVASATAYIPIHVFGGEEISDPTQPFQVYIEGVQYVFADGNYTRSADGVVGQFEVDIPVYLPTIVPLGLVSIYRLGVLDFRGILTRIERTLSDNPTVKLKGAEAAWLLNTRTVPLASFTGTPASILTSLLDEYPCGIMPGQISLTSAAINEFFVSVQLLAAVNATMKAVTGQRTVGTTVALTTGQYRLNPNLTLDANVALGNVTSAKFVEATIGNACILMSGSNVATDTSLISNSVHAANSSKLTAQAQNSASILQYGLIETTDQEPSVTDLPTLSEIAEFDAVKDAAAGLMVDLLAIDTYPSGTYNLYDYVGVNSPTLGLSGLYQVKQITRSTLTNPYATELQLGARIPEIWQLDEPIKNTMNQLAGVLVAPGGAPPYPVVLPLAVDATAWIAGSSSTYTTNLTHGANVTILIFVISGASVSGGVYTWYSVNSVTVGGANATFLTKNTGSPTFLLVYAITVAAAGTDTITVNLNGSPGGGGGFTAISIKNSTTNQIDANGVAAGAATAGSPGSSGNSFAPVTIGNGTVGRMIVVATATVDDYSYPGPTLITLDGQLVLANAWPTSANGDLTLLSVGVYLDNSGNGLTFNDAFTNPYYSNEGWAASLAAAVKP
jgi:hypothetical protein